jgi:ABC-2 type transport system ATP-binding protein
MENPMLEIKHVTKSYGPILAVDDITLSVQAGQIYGLLGLNGAGKTTTFRMIMNLFSPDQGEILLNGQPIGYAQMDQIGFLSEDRSLMTKMTVKEQMIFYGRLKGMNKKDALQAMHYWLDRFNIKEYETRKIKELSKGNQQKIQFITAVMHQPDLLILDEPFNGLDPINVELFIDVIREFQQNGKAIIFSSHQMHHIEQFCESMSLLRNGKVVLAGNIQQIKEDFKQKNIFIRASLDTAFLRELEGVVDVIEHPDRIEVKVADASHTQNVFEFVKLSQDVQMFDVRLPSLHEVFVAKVGEVYEEE